MGKTLSVVLSANQLDAVTVGDIARGESVTLAVTAADYTPPAGSYTVVLQYGSSTLAAGILTVVAGVGSGTLDLDTIEAETAFVSGTTRYVEASFCLWYGSTLYCQTPVLVWANDAIDAGSPIPAGRLHNLTAMRAPLATDDTEDGYGVGSMWINVTADTAYVCVDASTGAAVWNRIDGIQWPTADGSALADANRFSVGQEAGGVWTWVAKTGTQVKAWLKTYFDTLYAAASTLSGHITTHPAPTTRDARNAVAGANGDITSLSGLTTPLSVVQGGTGAATAAAALTALGAAARQPVETALGTLGASQAIDWADTVYTGTVGEALELTLGDNWPAAGNSAAVDLVLDNSGGYAITWTLVDYWAGTAPSGAGVYLMTIWSVAGTIYAAGVARGDGT